MNNYGRYVLATICVWNAGFALAQPAPIIPTLSCLSNPRAFNTGVNDDASKITAGSQDLQWWFTSIQQNNVPPLNLLPPAGATWTPAYVPVTPPPYAYPAQAEWISPRADGRTVPPPYPFNPHYTNYYRTQFILAPDVPLSAVNFNLNYVVDDISHGAFVNDTPTTSSVSPLALTGPWVHGLNTIIVPVDDIGWNTGLVVDSEPPAALSICNVSPIKLEKTIGQTTYTTGQTATYTIKVTSLGLVDSTGVQLTDPTPSGLSSPQWSCAASGTATCPSTVGGAPFSFNLPGNSSLTFTLTGTVRTSGSLSNTATVNPGSGVCAADTATPCAASASATLTAGGAGTGTPTPVPSLQAWALILLGTLTVLAFGWMSKRPKRSTK